MKPGFCFGNRVSTTQLKPGVRTSLSHAAESAEPLILTPLQIFVLRRGGAAAHDGAFLTLGRWAAAVGSAAAVVSLRLGELRFARFSRKYARRFIWESSHLLISWKRE